MTLVSNTTTNLSFFLTQSGQRCIAQLCRSNWDRASQPRAGPDYTSAQKLFSPLPVFHYEIANSEIHSLETKQVESDPCHFFYPIATMLQCTTLLLHLGASQPAKSGTRLHQIKPIIIPVSKVGFSQMIEILWIRISPKSLPSTTCHLVKKIHLPN